MFPHWGMRDLHVLGAAEPGKVEQLVGVAHNYDELVDSPAEVGTFRQSEFKEDGATYHVVVDGNPADYDMAKLDQVLAPDHPRGRGLDAGPPLRRIHISLSPAARTWWWRDGARLRHCHRSACRNGVRESLLPLAGVSAHEFFHLWNVKRIRPSRWSQSTISVRTILALSGSAKVSPAQWGACCWCARV